MHDEFHWTTLQPRLSAQVNLQFTGFMGRWGKPGRGYAEFVEQQNMRTMDNADVLYDNAEVCVLQRYA